MSTSGKTPGKGPEIPVTYKYKEKTRTGMCYKSSTIRELRRTLEKQISFPIKNMKLIYKGNNILLKAETTKVYDFFGDVKEITLEVAPKDFSEQEFIEKFEKAFVGVLPPEIIKEEEGEGEGEGEVNRQKPKLKAIYNDKEYIPKFKDRPTCSYDNQNEATFICINCGLYWCQYCMKYEVHKEDLVEISQMDVKFQYNRNMNIKKINEAVVNDAVYSKLEKIDFLLNEKVSVIEKQFQDMVDIIQKIKESQMHFIIDYFYQKISDKKYKSIAKDVDFFIKTTQTLQANFEKENVELNIKDDKTMSNGLDLIIQKFEDFKVRYNDFNNIFVQYDNFNQTLQSQLEAKINQSHSVGQSIMNPAELDKAVKAKEDIDLAIGKKDKTVYVIKIKYYNSILIWNHLKQKLIRINDFIDQAEFKLNYQVYAGNIFLNYKNRLFIVTGSNFNMFYFYDPNTNEIYRLPSLGDNHCRGGMIYVEFLNSILCLSGKYSKRVEYFSLGDFKFPLATTKGNNSIKSNYVSDQKLKWDELPQLHIPRHYSSFALHESKYLYVFFGYNQTKGDLDSIEKLDLSRLNEQGVKWELIKYENPKGVDTHINSHSVCYANKDEIYILGGSVREKFTNTILKYNFKQNTIFKTDFTIPSILENEYYRFWEESSFLSLTSKGFISNSDDDFTFGLMDAKDKLHLFNIRTFKYNII